MKRQPLYLREESHLYSICSHPSYWFEVGRSSTEQAIWGLINDRIYTIRFSLAGELVRVEHGEPDEARGKGTAADQRYAFRLASEQRRLSGLADGAISVRRFWLEGARAGVEDVGPDLREFIEDPGSVEDESGYREMLDDWLSNGQFAFWWEECFEVNWSGEVETS